MPCGWLTPSWIKRRLSCPRVEFSILVFGSVIPFDSFCSITPSYLVHLLVEENSHPSFLLPVLWSIMEIYAPPSLTVFSPSFHAKHRVKIKIVSIIFFVLFYLCLGMRMTVWVEISTVSFRWSKTVCYKEF
jgi:hypothetical protein